MRIKIYKARDYLFKKTNISYVFEYIYTPEGETGELVCSSTGSGIITREKLLSYQRSELSPPVYEFELSEVDTELKDALNPKEEKSSIFSSLFAVKKKPAPATPEQIFTDYVSDNIIKIERALLGKVNTELGETPAASGRELQRGKYFTNFPLQEALKKLVTTDQEVKKELEKIQEEKKEEYQIYKLDDSNFALTENLAEVPEDRQIFKNLELPYEKPTLSTNTNQSIKLACFDFDLTVCPIHIHHFLSDKRRNPDGSYQAWREATDQEKTEIRGRIQNTAAEKKYWQTLFNDLNNKGIKIAIVTFSQWPEVIQWYLREVLEIDGSIEIKIIDKLPVGTKENPSNTKNWHINEAKKECDLQNISPEEIIFIDDDNKNELTTNTTSAAHKHKFDIQTLGGRNAALENAKNFIEASITNQQQAINVPDASEKNNSAPAGFNYTPLFEKVSLDPTYNMSEEEQELYDKCHKKIDKMRAFNFLSLIKSADQIEFKPERPDMRAPTTENDPLKTYLANNIDTKLAEKIRGHSKNFINDNRANRNEKKESITNKIKNLNIGIEAAENFLKRVKIVKEEDEKSDNKEQANALAKEILTALSEEFLDSFPKGEKSDKSVKAYTKEEIESLFNEFAPLEDIKFEEESNSVKNNVLAKEREESDDEISQEIFTPETQEKIEELSAPKEERFEEKKETLPDAKQQQHMSLFESRHEALKKYLEKLIEKIEQEKKQHSSESIKSKLTEFQNKLKESFSEIFDSQNKAMENWKEIINSSIGNPSNVSVSADELKRDINGYFDNLQAEAAEYAQTLEQVLKNHQYAEELALKNIETLNRLIDKKYSRLSSIDNISEVIKEEKKNIVALYNQALDYLFGAATREFPDAFKKSQQQFIDYLLNGIKKKIQQSLETKSSVPEEESSGDFNATKYAADLKEKYLQSLNDLIDDNISSSYDEAAAAEKKEIKNVIENTFEIAFSQIPDKFTFGDPDTYPEYQKLIIFSIFEEVKEKIENFLVANFAEAQKNKRKYLEDALNELEQLIPGEIKTSILYNEEPDKKKTQLPHLDALQQLPTRVKGFDPEFSTNENKSEVEKQKAALRKLVYDKHTYFENERKKWNRQKMHDLDKKYHYPADQSKEPLAQQEKENQEKKIALETVRDKWQRTILNPKEKSSRKKIKGQIENIYWKQKKPLTEASFKKLKKTIKQEFKNAYNAPYSAVKDKEPITEIVEEKTKKTVSASVNNPKDHDKQNPVDNQAKPSDLLLEEPVVITEQDEKPEPETPPRVELITAGTAQASPASVLLAEAKGVPSASQPLNVSNDLGAHPRSIDNTERVPLIKNPPPLRFFVPSPETSLGEPKAEAQKAAADKNPAPQAEPAARTGAKTETQIDFRDKSNMTLYKNLMDENDIDDDALVKNNSHKNYDVLTVENQAIRIYSPQLSMPLFHPNKDAQKRALLFMADMVISAVNAAYDRGEIRIKTAWVKADSPEAEKILREHYIKNGFVVLQKPEAKNTAPQADSTQNIPTSSKRI